MSVRFTNNLPRMRVQVHNSASRVVRKFVAEIEARIKVSFSEAKHGNIDSRGHQASAPGEAPAIDYGVLANSTQSYMETDTKGGVGVGAEYGPHLEFGTSSMEPRPFMVPAAESVRRDFQESLRRLA